MGDRMRSALMTNHSTLVCYSQVTVAEAGGCVRHRLWAHTWPSCSELSEVHASGRNSHATTRTSTTESPTSTDRSLARAQHNTLRSHVFVAHPDRP